MRGKAPDVGAPLHVRDAQSAVTAHAGQTSDLVAVGVLDRITDSGTGRQIDDAQRPGLLGRTRIHPLDQLLARIAALPEAHGNTDQAGGRRNRGPGLDLVAHPWPPGRDPCELVLDRRGRHARALERGVGVDADLEAIQSLHQRLAEAGVSVEDELVVRGVPDPGERVDLAARIEDERPPGGGDREVAEVLRDLGLEVRLGVGSAHRHAIAGRVVDEVPGGGHRGIGVHDSSLPCQTSNDMDESDDPSRRGRDDDEPIVADSVRGPRSGAPLDELARRAVGALLALLRRANAFAGGVLIFSIVACIGGYLLGIAALDDGARAVWVVLGGVFAAWSIGAVLVAMWRLYLVRRGSAALVGEVRSLIGGDLDSQRTVVETVEVSEDSVDVGVVQVTRQFSSWNDLVKGRGASYAHLSLALRSITTFPGLMALATFIGFVFLAVSMIFLLILIF